MLSLMESRGSGMANCHSVDAVKLISGTNPLSALLGKELKHTIVTNSCSFRTPDPVSHTARPTLRQGAGIHHCDWEQDYRARGVPEARVQFLRAMGCFELPPPARCAELLEIFFTYIHPMLPVIERKEFLSQYYGCDHPPPLVLLLAVFLAASRYFATERRSANGVSENRIVCDDLHARLQGLLDVDIMHERVAVVQASLIASLHWEGREGLNSAIHSLSLAVRASQEMGYHRRSEPGQELTGNASSQDVNRRRIWWSAYILDRLYATQEGTPFLINERDCDVEALTENHLAGEDHITVLVTMLNLSLAHLIEEAVRSLYAPGESHITQFSSRGVHQRQQLTLKLDALENRVACTLLSGYRTDDALKYAPYDVSVLCGTLLQAQ
jgi:hypothetical protein